MLCRTTIENKTFVTGVSDLKQLQPATLGPDTKACIYLWRNKVWCVPLQLTRLQDTGKGYVGVSKNKRKKRDKLHLEGRHTFFEKCLDGDDSEWDVITVCQFANEVKWTIR